MRTLWKLLALQTTKWEVDHIKPKSEGGDNSIKNKQLLHRHCHDTKTA